MSSDDTTRPIDPQVCINLNGLLKKVEDVKDAPKVGEGPKDL